MKYRKDRKGNDISILGFGCMRFTKKGNKFDFEKAEAEVMEAVHNGVNYFDTAYVYSGSEVLMGQIFAKNKCRDQIKIATKLPHYLIKSRNGIEKLFQEELTRLQTDHVDYYLMHMLTDTATWEKLKKLGIEEWIEEKIASGQIRNIGFSYHGNSDMFCKLLDAYDWDFCQIQYNYMDENSQAGRRGLEYAESKGIPVIIMEPLRGGKLVNLLPEGAKKLFADKQPKRSPAEWALRWLWNQSGVTCILSGMNSMEMVKENIRVASEAEIGELTEEDQRFFEEIKAEISRSIKVGCTGCGYCMPCPKGVDIPGTFRCYNEIYTENRATGRFEYLQCTAFRKEPSSASLCVKCGKCEQHCPQHLPIREELEKAASELENVSYKFMKAGIKLLHLW